MTNTVWNISGTDIHYEHYRNSSRMPELQQWVDDAYHGKSLAAFLDENFLEEMRNNDFFARLWELKLAEELMSTGLTMVPTNGTGPDFCIQLSDGRNVWIEAVLPTPDDAMDEAWRASISRNGELAKVFDFPKDENALRYGSSLFTKAIKIREKYMDKTIDGSFMLIAISGFPPGSLHSDIEHFMRAALPMGDPVVHISTTDQPIDPDVVRPTHTGQPEYTKKNGSIVLKQFLYPGTYFPFVDGVLFTEASDLQQILGTYSSRFDDSTKVPHVFPNHASNKKLPSEFTNNFYNHEFIEDSPLISLRVTHPRAKQR